MLRRLNSTGRRKIEAGRIGIRPSDGAPRGFTTTLDLDGLGLPQDAAVVIEAQRLSAVERFPLGTVGGLAKDNLLTLVELAADDALQFRVKVVEPGTGRLVALARGIKPGDQDESGRLSLMTVKEKDLGSEPWRVEIEGGEVVLAVNQRIPDAIGAIGRPGAIQSLVLAAAFRQVLLMLWAERADPEDDDEPDGWQAKWLQFAEALAGRELEDWDDDPAGWIGAACSEFAKRHDLVYALAAMESA